MLVGKEIALVFNKKPWVRFSVPLDEDGQSRTLKCSRDNVVYDILTISESAGTYTAQLPFEIDSYDDTKFWLNDGLADGNNTGFIIQYYDLAPSFNTPAKPKASDYNEIATFINYLRRYYGLTTFTFNVVAEELVKAEHTNTLLSALEDIHKLLPTTNKFDKVKKGDLITRKTYNQIINGLKEG